MSDHTSNNSNSTGANASGTSTGLVPVQHDRRSGVRGLGEVSAPGWVMARLSLLPGEDLRHIGVDVSEYDHVQVHLHQHDTQTLRRVAGDLGFGVEASIRSDLPRGTTYGGAFTAFRWKSSNVFERISLIWYTDRHTADLAVRTGLVTLPPAPADRVG